MSTIKSHSVGNGDMFYVDHNSDNFTIIDCCLNGGDEGILAEVAQLAAKKGIVRFISTHPDDDHLRGLVRLDDRIGILNFYCVKNATTKAIETDSFVRYRQLRDSAKAFYIEKDCTRKWMNLGDAERGSSGINILWPDPANAEYKKALACANAGGSPNNISAIIRYALNGGVSAVWMGDLETDFMESISSHITLPQTDLVFAPHHGRASGRIPKAMLDQLSPRVVIIGEAPSEHLHYYCGYNTITQNSTGDIVFECEGSDVHIFTELNHTVGFLKNKFRTRPGYYYLGTLEVAPTVSSALAAATYALT